MSTDNTKIYSQFVNQAEKTAEKTWEDRRKKVLLPHLFSYSSIFYFFLRANIGSSSENSACALGVHIGTLTDPPTEMGLAHFCEHLLSVLSEHGVSLDVTPNALDAMLAVNGEEYKHFGEKNLIELPQSVIWSQYYLKELHIPEERLAPFAEELSFLYDHERVINSPRPYLTNGSLIPPDHI